VHAQVASGFLGPGKTTERFAAGLCELLKAPSCTLTTSGTVALTVAAHACGLRPGDEVLVPAYGVVSTINGFASAGLRPRLVEIDRRTGCIDPNVLAREISQATKAICFVNFSGYTGSNLDAVVDLASERRIPLIEDAATAIGHRHAGRSAGTFGTAGTLSFSPPKTVTTGQGGAVVTSSPELRDAAAAYVDHGDLSWRQTNLNRDVGTNLRFNDVLSALGLAQLRNLDERLARKRRAYAALRELLGDRIFSVPGDEAPLFNIVFSAEAQRLADELRRRGIGAVRQYRTISQHPAYAHLAGPFPASDWWTDCAVYLPFGLALTEDEATRIARAVLETGIELLVP
ncbi:MAG: DegT/DnrJ/EryC1/StrS family aminotransferase, partial [Vulcanimicrobiaceae bacterium]